MIIIEYTPNGQPISDFAVDEFVNQLTPGHWTVGTENVLFEIKARVKEGKLSNVVFCWNRQMFAVNSDGTTKYPEGFPDFQTERLIRVFGI